MNITSDLHLGFPIRWAEGVDPKTQQPAPVPTVWAYHTPIDARIFEANYRVIAAAQLEIADKGIVGQRIATYALRDAARQDALDHGQDPALPSPLLADIKRLTLVLAPGPTGYDLLPIDAALARGVIDQDDWTEAESALVFFTCAYTMVPRMARERVANAYASVMRGSITSLPPMEYAASLPTSTSAETSAPPPEPSSVPS